MSVCALVKAVVLYNGSELQKKISDSLDHIIPVCTMKQIKGHNSEPFFVLSVFLYTPSLTGSTPSNSLQDPSDDIVSRVIPALSGEQEKNGACRNTGAAQSDFQVPGVPVSHPARPEHQQYPP